MKILCKKWKIWTIKSQQNGVTLEILAAIAVSTLLNFNCKYKSKNHIEKFSKTFNQNSISELSRMKIKIKIKEWKFVSLLHHKFTTVLYNTTVPHTWRVLFFAFCLYVLLVFIYVLHSAHNICFSLNGSVQWKHVTIRFFSNFYYAVSDFVEIFWFNFRANHVYLFKSMFFKNTRRPTKFIVFLHQFKCALVSMGICTALCMVY